MKIYTGKAASPPIDELVAVVRPESSEPSSESAAEDLAHPFRIAQYA